MVPSSSRAIPARLEEAMSTHVRSVWRLLAAAAYMATVYSAAAQVTDNTRYVSINGNNANACTLAAPCRTLQHGIDMTPIGGELRILDSGVYGGRAVIRRALTVSGNGNTVYLGSPINIAAEPTSLVALRGLVLDGQGQEHGIIIGGKTEAVHIERCVIQGFIGDGIHGSARVKLVVLDTVSRFNRGSGLRVPFNDVASSVTIDNSRFDNNNLTGIEVSSVGHTAISRSVASGNSTGIFASNGTVTVTSTMVTQNQFEGLVARGGATMTVESSVSNGNGAAGLLVDNSGTARISNSTFVGNAIGIRNAGSTLETRGNNTVRGNPINTQGTLTPIGGV